MPAPAFAFPTRMLLAGPLLALLAGCAAPGARTAAADAPVAVRASGYLHEAAVPDSLALVPAPPAAGSAGFALDEQVSREALALRGSARFQQAHRDAELGFPEGADQFTCALGLAVDAQRTPALYRLLERSRIDASAATRAAKKHYQRPRPFMANGEPTCTPEDETACAETAPIPPDIPRSAGPGR